MLTTALLFIILGAVFDFFDGFSARLLRVASPIGKELDSLADVVTFGMAPAAMVFSLMQQMTNSNLHDCSAMKSIPYAVFLLVAFSALRLAKFNLDSRQSHSFIGLPTPANALFWASATLFLSTRLEFIATQQIAMISLLLAALLCFCFLMISEIPMFALKFTHFGWKGNVVRYSFLLFSAGTIIICALLDATILSPAIIVILYIACSILTHTK